MFDDANSLTAQLIKDLLFELISMETEVQYHHPLDEWIHRAYQLSENGRYCHALQAINNPWRYQSSRTGVEKFGLGVQSRILDSILEEESLENLDFRDYTIWRSNEHKWRNLWNQYKEKIGQDTLYTDLMRKGWGNSSGALPILNFDLHFSERFILHLSLLSNSAKCGL
jgi:hypothetical protein